MKDLKIPQGYQTIMPYLIIKNANGFLQFTQQVFGAVEKHKTMRSEGVIAHAEIIVDDCTIMFADSTDKFASRNASLFIYVESADDTYKKAIDAGASTVMELSNESYGRTCGVEDPFGNVWWITSV